MKPQKFPEHTVVYAKDQPEYVPLPVYQFQDNGKGEIVCCWKLSIKERWKLLFSGKIWHNILTFNNPLQPQLLSVTKPKMPNHTNINSCDTKVSFTKSQPEPRRRYG